MNRSVDTAPTQKRLIGSVDDDIDIEACDVAAYDLDSFRSDFRHEPHLFSLLDPGVWNTSTGAVTSRHATTKYQLAMRFLPCC